MMLTDKCQNRYKCSLRQLGETGEKTNDLGSHEYQGAGWSAAAFASRGTVPVPLPLWIQPAAERGPGTRCNAIGISTGELGACPLLLLGTYLST